MQIPSEKIVQSVGDESLASDLVQKSAHKIEATDVDQQAANFVFQRLESVSKILEENGQRFENFSVNLEVTKSTPGAEAASLFLQKVGEQTIAQPVPTIAEKVPAAAPILISSTMGGMGIGLVGGIGFGIAIDALRNTANATGNPILSNLALGLGLAGSAVGALVGSGGSLDIELPGIKISAKSKVDKT